MQRQCCLGDVLVAPEAVGFCRQGSCSSAWESDPTTEPGFKGCPRRLTFVSQTIPWLEAVAPWRTQPSMLPPGQATAGGTSRMMQAHAPPCSLDNMAYRRFCTVRVYHLFTQRFASNLFSHLLHTPSPSTWPTIQRYIPVI